MDIVNTQGLGKRYGSTTVVDDLNLRIPEGCVYGFLGPNGSGKSTTMKMLLSLVTPSSGQISLFGRPLTRETRRDQLAQVGSLIEAPPGYGHLTGAENLRVVQRSLGLRADQIDRAVRTARLQDQLDKKVRNYSLGMKQRLGIAMALAREPRLLVLDEPTNGLDPAGIEEIRELLRHLASHGVTVMVSSHLLGEIDRTADVLGILSGGRMIFQGSRSDLTSAATPDVLIDTVDPDRAGAVLREKLPTRVDGHTVRVTGIDDRTTARVVEDLVGAGAGVYGVRRDEQSLEDVFMNLTSGGRL
ncbi:ATP-binding cassette domain-containing protein [Rhodococcus sp. BP-149]|uniref:ABC transporter ATP-binding protein n=1 Tax=unclassified Rhodococcus (in: high G+C Gram-positive bacteria) TaxID=192944 RepID=UPI001C9A3872|nr:MULTISPECIES: ATP-binding cassette domain-containing protein [unclassified Rhodococcus (in: high G+C Gram-positive bacteria)]MBY6687152.1 ATP-binding cassette domain-containing protein [Rhodococcus sp. BP-288]MBY6694425.1 ATP-binding cassette domain-containing protein [Rhodococcus sp. BP-188]MBY6698134.1 ATP-binding cassette domain-containing protein [Rhodococcus sp. BP-285]MBY6704354.1 ATP-binding cassette domain-containing protein [Rhodococcus sp. BP-283]MBY6713003.1 ATP-binding cassette 